MPRRRRISRHRVRTRPPRGSCWTRPPSRKGQRGSQAGRWTGRGRGMREGRVRPETVPFLLFLCLPAMFCLFVFSFVSSWSFFSLFLSFVSALERRRPYFGWQQSVVEGTGYLEKPHHRCHALSYKKSVTYVYTQKTRM